MKKVFYFPLLFLCLIPSVRAQVLNYTQIPEYLHANAYWAYYNHIGLDWSNGAVAYDSSALTSFPNTRLPGFDVTLETGATAVSDPRTGKLLFYTNGENTWDKNHELMPNGNGLGWPHGVIPSEGSKRGGDHALQVIPFVGDSTKYYIFSRGAWLYYQRDSSYQLYYSVLDMELNNNKGDIVAAQKNIPFSFTNSYWPRWKNYDYRNVEDRQKYLDYIMYHGMTTIPGNNCDVWLVTLVSKHNENTLDTLFWDGGNPQNEFSKDLYYYAYRISESGIDTVPVISPSASPHGFDDPIFTVSPDRKKLFVAERSLMMKNYSDLQLFHGKFSSSELARFDPNTGIVSEPMVFDFYDKLYDFNPNGMLTDFFNVASAAFSPDSRKLYTTNSNFFASAAYINQYDLEQYDAASIRNSRFTVDSFVNSLPPSSCQGMYSMTLKPYRDSIFVIWGDQPKIGSINLPNNLGTSCDFQLDYFSLPLDKPNGGNAFNGIVYPMYTENMLVSEINSCEPQLLEPRFTHGSRYQWNDGSTASTLTATGDGVYWVSYSVFEDNCIHLYTDSFKITREGFPQPTIRINVDTLSTVLEYEQYQWLLDGQLIPNATDRNYLVTQNGDYSVVTVNAEGCVDTSEVYPVTDRGVSIGALGTEHHIRVFPNPAQDKVFIQSDQPLKYRLMDMMGREILGLQQGRVINISALSKGVYQLLIYDRNGVPLGNWKISKQ